MGYTDWYMYPITLLPGPFWFPQGSLLGPLLFIVIINDLTDVVLGDVFTSFYADDTTVYCNINTIEDCMSMQKTLTNMDTWTWHNKKPSIALNGPSLKRL